MKRLVSYREIEAARTPNGGFTREQLAEWGISWPPPKGWQKKLLKGDDDDRRRYPLNPSDRQAIKEYLPRLRFLHQRALENRRPWASLYAVDIKCLEHALKTGFF